MRESNLKTIYLKGYTPPDFLIDRIDLQIELEEENTRVVSHLYVRRNPEAHTIFPLVLDGEGVSLEGFRLNGRMLENTEYRLCEENLTLLDPPEGHFQLEIVTRICPKANTELEGLYLSNGMFCTQCEAQGFRKITYFLDRPDVMAVYTTTLIANSTRYPVLLSNGNIIAKGKKDKDRHWVTWRDPFKKPAYLFALVAGDLACFEGKYVTQSARTITLRIFVEPVDLDKCEHALESLKHAMRWDEERYGREYDLDLYMIVAVSHFNMGAMENKGLNIFNTKYVLARPDTATDSDYLQIESVIGHEYFHNWTGNRITCRDWFQLSLKEGLTVFRDQQFSADRTSFSVKRIDEVNLLRTRQFTEDAGPLAHPVRPESYIEINNFYTLTVYEKGAEVVRMLHTLLGESHFRRGMDLYFERHDGHAVTCDDFVQCMEETSGLNLTQFRRWYSQSGTPEVHIYPRYDAQQHCLEITFRQNCPATPGQPHKDPFYIPLALGLLALDGSELPLQLAGESAPAPEKTRVLPLIAQEERFCFVGLSSPPVISALRGFSAPVKLYQERTYQELAFLFMHDTDSFNRWDAGQELSTHIIRNAVEKWVIGQQSFSVPSCLIETFQCIVQQKWEDLSYFSLLLTLPSEEYISAELKVIEPEAVHSARQWMKKELAHRMESDWTRLYETHHRDEHQQLHPQAMGRRRLKNACLGYIGQLENETAYNLAIQQFHESRSMTDTIAALSVIMNTRHPHKEPCLERFYEKWKGEALVIAKWFTLQASSPLPDTLKRVKALLLHPAFDMRSPNYVRSLIGAFCQSNPVNFHAKDGSGYEFLAEHVIELNEINPQIAARLLTSLTSWRRYDSERQRLMCAQLQRVAGTPTISKDVYEVAMKSLG